MECLVRFLFFFSHHVAFLLGLCNLPMIPFQDNIWPVWETAKEVHYKENLIRSKIKEVRSALSIRCLISHDTSHVLTYMHACVHTHTHAHAHAHTRTDL